MATTLESKGFPTEFTHPAAGPSTRVANRVAVRWVAGVTDDQRIELLAIAAPGGARRGPSIAGTGAGAHRRALVGASRRLTGRSTATSSSG